MKKILPGFLAIAIAFAASAFTAPTSAQRTAADPHWFDPNGNYTGQRSVAAQDLLCPDGNTQLCARGYAQINEDEEPVESSFVQDIMKP